jgi:hypothetical protein
MGLMRNCWDEETDHRAWMIRVVFFVFFSILFSHCSMYWQLLGGVFVFSFEQQRQKMLMIPESLS